VDEALVATLKEQIVETLGLDDVTPAEIGTDAPLFGPGQAAGSLGLDSIDALELVVMLEKHHGIRLEDMETGKAAFRTVGALAEFIRERA
jgi:acyl carrier protein